MLVVEHKSLLKRLTKNCVNALEAAANQAVAARHYEITVEHFLLALLDDADSDIAFVVSHYDLNPAQLRAALQRGLDDLRTGNSGRPTFSPVLLEWFQNAWLIGSVDFGFTKIRSGVLMLCLVQQTSRYSQSGIGVYLEGIPRDDMKKQLPTMLSGSKEGAEAVAGAPGPGGAAAGGKGVGDKGSVSPDSALAKFCVDYTGRARAGEIDPIFGREREIRQIIDILARRRKNNPIIVGDSGVGKTALVEGLALNIVNNEVPPLLQGTEILGLDLGLLQAGASVKGEFENRMKQVISEVKGSAKPIILFIDEAHTIIGAGGAQGSGDAANLLKPALARGELRTIAATTWKEYKKYFEKDAALERRFQPVKVDEPDVPTAITMLRGLRSKFEDAHGVIIQDEAVSAAVRLSARFISGRQLPDKAVDLLDTCSARVKVALQQKPAAVEDVEVVIKNTEREIEALKRDKSNGVKIDEEHLGEIEKKLEDAKVELQKVTAAYSAETEGAKKVLEARKRMTDAKTESERDEIRKEVVAALNELDKMQGEVPLIRPDVDEAMVANVVSAWTGIPAGKMVQDDVKNLLEMEDRLRRRIKGQDYGIATIAKELRAARAGLKPQSTPMGVFLLVGPSGVGKTETALSLADLLYGGERMMVTVNMSEFQEKHTVSRLIGSPPGYVGFGEGGMLTEAVRQRPYTVVLLDECEKADPDVMNLFYQVFDKGMLSDGEGRLVDFKNTVIIMTSNLATDKITNMTVATREETGQDPPMSDIMESIKPTVSSHFKPALLARMTMVPYLPISASALGSITKLKLDALLSRLRANQRIEASYSDRLIEMIAARCTEVDTGARNIDHILRSSLLPMLSAAILEKLTDPKPPKKLFIDIDDQKNFTAAFSD
ncbi:MAG TPA: type VI secretion system ATPase TssH [Polyangiaceae bacterium]|nr:type VI secretion system ATPase TssH [Polyangiaceae bacterium]